MNRYAVIVFAVCCATSARAEAVSERPDGLTLTLYHEEGLETSDLVHPSDWMRGEGLAFITETRTINLETGPNVIRFRGVASTMVPQTAEIKGLPSGIAERNFDYELLSPASLIEKSVGKTVHLVRSDPTTGRKTEVVAIVRSGPNGTFLDIGGKLEALRCSGLPETLVFDEIPQGLADTPTLSVRTISPVAGGYTLKLSYIATGLNWSADYVARVAPDGRTLDLTGWLTLANFSANGFRSVPLSVVAGRLNTTGEDKPVHPESPVASAQCWPTNIDWTTYTRLASSLPPPPPPPAVNALGEEEVQTVVVTGSRIPDPRLLGDYKIYSLPEPATLHANETKQIQFLDKAAVSFEKLYRFDVDLYDDTVAQDGRGAAVVLRLKNDLDSGLGKPLPAGSVSVLEQGGKESPVFTGQASIADTAVGSPFDIETGHAMDVRAEQRVVNDKTTGSGDSKRTRKSIMVIATNDKDFPIHFEIRQGFFASGTRILSDSRPHDVVGNSAVWKFEMPARSRAILEYTVEYAAS